MTENPNHVEPERTSGRTWKDVLVSYRWVLAVAIGAALVIGLYLGYEPEIPRSVKLFGIAALLSGALGYPVAARIVAWLWRPRYTYLVDVDARDSDFSIWELPPSAWRDLEVLEDEIYELRAAAPAWEVKDYDPVANTCRGTWRGSATDLEMIEEQERIDEIRGILEDLAKEGLSIRVKQSGIVRKAVRGIVMSLVEGFEKETLYEGSEVVQAVEDALERWNLREQKDPEDGTADDGSLTEDNVGYGENGQKPEFAND